MSTHKHIDRICCLIMAAALLLTLLLMNGEALGLQNADRSMGYESRLFDTSRVHTIDIVMDDWDGFLSTCENEEYTVCSAVIDGEAYKNIGIRAKGNTSLSTVSSMGSDRYSFKIEFDQYDSTTSYHGLDKLSLNNLIQDTTMMKDYLTYQMMAQFGAAAPLCSYAWLTVNGEDWGLYLAVEAVEDAFLQRNYGSDHGELYKPDSMNFGAGRGNGKNFNMEEFDFESMERTPERSGQDSAAPSGESRNESGRSQQTPGNFDPSAMFGQNGGMTLPEGFDPSAMSGQNGGMTLPEGFDPSAMFGAGGEAGSSFGEGAEIPDGFDFSSLFGGMGGFGMGGGDAKLQYIDDDPASYSTIFDSAKTDISSADQTRLIAALKALSSAEGIETAVDLEAALRYFVVHNFVVNGDSYTGSMVHNYYLYEQDGLLSMIPWDYNLAFGTFQGSSAQSAVNDPIDTPLSVTGSGDRPMIDWIFSDGEYTALYHQYFEEFLTGVDFLQIIDSAAELIAPYVEKDPTKFCTAEEFASGVAALREFCTLRAESVRGQLAGTVPSTSAGQSADGAALVDTGELNLSDMGSMNMGGGMGGRGDKNFDRGENTGRSDFPGGTARPEDGAQTPTGGSPPTGDMTFPEGFAPTDGMTFPEGFAPSDGMTFPGGAQPPQEG